MRSALFVSLLLAGSLAVADAAQPPTMTFDGDEVTVRGCVTRIAAPAAADTLVWSRGEMMLAGVTATEGTRREHQGARDTLAHRVFYYVDHDEDLSQYMGREVELKGELDDFATGQLEVMRDGEFTEITLDLESREEKVRVPTSWLRDRPHEAEFTIVARRIDVDDIRVVGTCRG
jgi:hypothetical protein